MSFLYSFLLSACVAATTGDLLSPWPAEVFRNEVISFKPKAGHHFSLEAPQKCGGRAAFDVTVKVVRCQFTQAGAQEAILNVCDDKKTFCRPVTASLKVETQAAAEPIRLVKNEHLNRELKKTLLPGFAVGTPSEIQKQSQEKKQPVFVMVSTDWCPPCNEAKEYLLKTQRFQELTANWFKVYVDGDSVQAAEWEKVVPYRYFPTFVLLNSNFKEVARFNRELREGEFATWAQTETAHLADPISALKDRVMSRRKVGFWGRMKGVFRSTDKVMQLEEETRLLRWALDQQDEPLIKELLNKGDGFPELVEEVKRFEISSLDASETPDPEKKKALYQELLKVTLEADDWAENLESFCDEDEKACAPNFAEAGRRMKWLSERQGLTPAERASVMGEELLYLASVAEKLKDSKAQKEFADQCLAQYSTLKGLSRLSLARSSQQYMVPCFEFAGRFKEAEAALKSLIKTYPSEPTFYLRLARVYRKQKQFEKALVQADQGIKVAYGYNWFTAVILKSDLLLDLKRVSEAESVVKEALREVQLSGDTSGRNQTLVGRLRAAQMKISNASLH